MNANEKDFDKRLDEIGQLYEDGKNAIYSLTDWNKKDDPDCTAALDNLRKLRDIAAMAIKEGYQIKEN